MLMQVYPKNWLCQLGNYSAIYSNLIARGVVYDAKEKELNRFCKPLLKDRLLEPNLLVRGWF